VERRLTKYELPKLRSECMVRAVGIVISVRLLFYVSISRNY
jgi:hypothetical protein